MEANDARVQHMRMVVRLFGRRKARGDWCQTLLTHFLEDNAQGDHHAAQVLESDNETQSQVVQFLPDDLLLKIFISLPAESLFRMQFVCKRWLILISNPTFVRLHTQQSQTLLICQKLAFAPKYFGEIPPCYFHIMDLQHARDNFVCSTLKSMVKVLSSCDGLVLVKRPNDDMSLILMNPVTRKYTELPPSMSTSRYEFHSYSIAFCNKENTYKVVHLFSEKGEILSISTRKWKLLEGYSSEEKPYRWQKMVNINGSVYWTPIYSHGRDYFITLNLQDEKCITRNLPDRRCMKDQLVDVGGVLGFVTHETRHVLQVWILNENGSHESNADWMKRCSIDLSLNFRHSVLPICSPRNGNDMIFSYPRGLLYVRDFDKGDTKSICSREDRQGWHESIETMYIPHQNTLASWET